jgi:hypothetical protein
MNLSVTFKEKIGVQYRVSVSKCVSLNDVLTNGRILRDICTSSIQVDVTTRFVLIITCY